MNTCNQYNPLIKAIHQDTYICTPQSLIEMYSVSHLNFPKQNLFSCSFLEVFNKSYWWVDVQFNVQIQILSMFKYDVHVGLMFDKMWFDPSLADFQYRSPDQEDLFAISKHSSLEWLDLRHCTYCMRSHT